MSIARALPYLLLAVLLGAAGYLAGAVTDPFGSGQPSVRGALAPEEPRLRRELEQARGEAAALTGELQRAQGTIDRLRADLDEARTRIAELQQRAEAAEEARATAEDRIAELAERVAKLEAEGAGDDIPAADAEASPQDTAEAALADTSADDAADGSGTSATTAGAGPDESASGDPIANTAASTTGAGGVPDAETGQVAEAPSATTANDTAANGDAASGGGTETRDNTETRSAPSAPADASDTAGAPADANIAGIGPPGFEEDPRPGSAALSSISPSTRQANRLVAGVQAYQDAAYQEAFLAWLPLAQAGYARAQLHLGALFLEGRGTDRNDPLAYAWLTVARNNGSRNAGPLLDQLQQRMTAEDLDTARKLLGRARQSAGSAE